MVDSCHLINKSWGEFWECSKKKDINCPSPVLPYSNSIFLSPPPKRGKKLDETLVLHEFLREYEDLQDWMAQQKQAASSEDYGNNYEHVLVSFLSNQSKINQIVCCQTVKDSKIVPENLED